MNARTELPPNINVVGTKLPKVVRAKGSYLWDVDGKQYIDGSGGPAVYCLGHANEEVNAAITAQLERDRPWLSLQFHHRRAGGTDRNHPRHLRRHAEGNGVRHRRVRGGGRLPEDRPAIPDRNRREISRRRFISRQRSWHGNTLGALGRVGFLERTLAYEGAFIPSIKLSPANAYRPIPGASAETAGQACADELEQAILREGPDTIAAFIFEPVVGAAGGCVPAPEGYARAGARHLRRNTAC